MRSSAEFSIDFSAEELLQESGPAQASIDPAIVSSSRANPPTSATPAGDDDPIEIELTAEQIDALLDGKL
jgi:hypothetical protein